LSGRGSTSSTLPRGEASAERRTEAVDDCFNLCCTRQYFLARMEDATNSMLNGDPSLWKELASHADDATLSR
jgi:hypothetical protein